MLLPYAVNSVEYSLLIKAEADDRHFFDLLAEIPFRFDKLFDEAPVNRISDDVIRSAIDEIAGHASEHLIVQDRLEAHLAVSKDEGTLA